MHMPSMDHARTHRLFTANSHLNALAPLTNGSIWCLLHNRGKVRQLLHSIVMYHNPEPSHPTSVLTLQTLQPAGMGFMPAFECTGTCRINVHETIAPH